MTAVYGLLLSVWARDVRQTRFREKHLSPRSHKRFLTLTSTAEDVSLARFLQVDGNTDEMIPSAFCVFRPYGKKQSLCYCLLSVKNSE